MATTVFGVEVELQDHTSTVTEDSTIGLYNIGEILIGTAAALQKVVAVDDGTVYEINKVVTISDDLTDEINVIDSISGDNLTMKTNLANTYTVANHARVDQNSVFRWIQNDVTSVTGWASDMLVKGGIGRFSRQINLKRGGNISTPGKCKVTVNNTAKFWNELSDSSIYFNGLKVRIYEFIDSVKILKWSGFCEKPDWKATMYVIPMTGDLNKRKSNLGTIISETNFPNATGEILSKMAPITIGEFKPSFDTDGNILFEQYAKFLRTANKKTKLIYKSFNNLTLGTDPSLVQLVDGDTRFDIQTFPVIEVSTLALKTCRLRMVLKGAWKVNNNYVDAGTLFLTDLIGQYIKVIKGAGEGEIRRIENATAEPTTHTDQTAEDNISILIEVENFFTEELVGNVTGDAAGNSWVEIIDVSRKYKVDQWPCFGFIDTSGNSITTGANLYTYDLTSDEFNQNAPYGFDVDTSETDNNLLTVDLKFFSTNFDTLTSFLTLPITAFDKYKEDDLLAYISGGASITERNFSNYGGIYSDTAIDVQHDFDPYFTDAANVLDKDSTTYQEWHVRISPDALGAVTYYLVTEATLPDLPKNFTFDAMYLGLKMDTTSDTTSSNPIVTELIVKTKSWFGRDDGGDADIISSSTFDDEDRLSEAQNLPDFYFTNDFDSSDQFFYVNQDLVALYSGYQNAEISGITTHEQYKGIKNIAILLKRTVDGVITTANHTAKYYGMSILLAKSSSIQKAIYTTFKGRIYNDTWGSRKTATDMISKPLDIIEHVCRLQNWSENNTAPTEGWGKAYPTNPSINTTTVTLVGNEASGATDIDVNEPDKLSVGDYIYIYDSVGNAEYNKVTGKSSATITLENVLTNNYVAATTSIYTEGGFDLVDSNLTVLESFSAARQILNIDNAYSDKIKKSLCKNFFLANWVNKHGEECITRIVKNDSGSIDTVTLSDIVERKGIKVTEPSPGDIYPEPFVRYNKNPATGEFQNTIKITNVSFDNPTADQKQGFVEGITGESAEEYWDRCHTLYTKTRFLTEPSNDLTDLHWANGDDGNAIALEYLDQWINWMYNPKIVFSVHYNKAKDWEETHRFTLTLPHQTNNIAIEAIVTKVTINPNSPYHIQIEAILFSEDIPADFKLQDSMKLYASDDDWQDDMDLQVDTDDNKQDVT